MTLFTPIDYPEHLRRKSNYYEFYSIKNKRNIQVYGTYAYYYSLILELDHNIISYCEYPFEVILEVSENKPYKSIFDFGVIDTLNNKIIHNFHSNSSNTKENSYHEECWCKQNDLLYKAIHKDEVFTNSYYLYNLKFLYGMLKRANEPIYIKYLNKLLNATLNEGNTLQQLVLLMDITMVDLYKVVALGLTTGQLTLPLKDNLINYNMEVRRIIL